MGPDLSRMLLGLGLLGVLVGVGWGWRRALAARPSRRDLYTAQRGASLLRDPSVTDRLWDEFDPTEIVRDSDKAALVVASLRLRGQPLAELERGAQGRAVLLGALVAEGRPPYWWADASWMADALGLQPDGSLRLGLMPRVVAEELVADPALTSFAETRALVRIAGLHPGLCSAQVVEAALDRWIEYQGELGWSLRQVREARDTLLEQGGGAGLTLTAGEGLDPATLPAIRATLIELLQTGGHAIGTGPGLSVGVSVEDREIPGVAVRVLPQHRVAEVAPVDASFHPSTDGWEGKVEHTESTARLVAGRARVRVLVLEFAGRRLWVPPFGLRRAQLPEGAPGPLLEFKPDHVLLSAWRWGI